MQHSGLINLNKPAGWTSRDAVNAVQRLARPARVGHAGTLDPLATGVLIVCVGDATRLIEYVQRMPKRYVGTFLLGRQSATEDIEGEIIELPDAPRPTREEIEAAASRFLGRINQRPPVFSALKIQGRPAYQLARQGKQVELQPRPIEIYDIAVRSYAYPELVLEVACGSGTYIRSLGRDLALSLGTGAVMSALTRTAIGDFHIDSAMELEQLKPDNWTAFIRPCLCAIDYLPKVSLAAAAATRIRNGLTITLPQAETQGQPNELVALDEELQLVGILTPCGPEQWRTLRNMPTGRNP